MWPKITLECGFASDPSVPIASTVWTDISAYFLSADFARAGRQYELDRATNGSMTVVLDGSDRSFEPEYTGSQFYPNILPLRRMRLRVGENYIANPSFETDLSSWTSGGATFTRDTGTFLIGAAAAKLVSTGASGNSIVSAATILAPLSGAKITATAYVKGSGSAIGKTAYVQVTETGGAFAEQSTAGAPLTLDGTWQRVQVTHTMIRNDRTGTYVTVGGTSFNTGDVLYIDGVQHVAGDAEQAYVDTVRSVWTGFVESWSTTYEQDYTEVRVVCTDGFEPLANANVIGGDNAVANPSLELNALDWTLTNGTLTRDTSKAAAGAACGKITAHATLAPTDARPDGLGLLTGVLYAISCWIYIPSGLSITPANVLIGLGIGTGGETTGTAVDLLDQWQFVKLASPVSLGGGTATFGKTSQGATYQFTTANNKYASKFVLSEAALVTSLTIECAYDENNSQPQVMKGVIYADSAGAPAGLLGTTVEVTLQHLDGRAFRIFTFATPVSLAAGTYWLGLHAGTVGPTGNRLYYDTTGGSSAENADTYSDGAANPFGAATTGTKSLAIYATYTVSATGNAYAFVRLNETGAGKYIFFDELIIRPVAVTDAALRDPGGADLGLARSGLRAARILNAISWPIADRVIDQGMSNVPAMAFASADEQKALSLEQDLSAAELGVFFCDGQGRACFHDRARRFNPVPVAIFTDATPAPGVYPYAKLVDSFDRTRILNDIRISAAGAPQTVRDDASQTKYLQRTFSQTLSLASDGQAHDIAAAILARSKDEHRRFDKLSLDPVLQEKAQPGLLNAVLAREVSDCVTVRFNPPAHPGTSTQISKDVHLEQITGHCDPPVLLTFDWQLSPVDTSTFLQLDDATKGKLDTPANALAF